MAEQLQREAQKHAAKIAHQEQLWNLLGRITAMRFASENLHSRQFVDFGDEGRPRPKQSTNMTQVRKSLRLRRHAPCAPGHDGCQLPMESLLTRAEKPSG